MARSKTTASRGARKKPKRAAVPKLGSVVAALQRIAPTPLAQLWDNVGLLAGDQQGSVRRLLLCIDMMPAVVDEAIAKRVDLVVSYHPPLFKPVKRLVAPGKGMDVGLFRCIRKGIAVYSPHTALDVAAGGTNDVLAQLCGVVDAQPLERPLTESRQVKVAVFVPTADAERVANAMFEAGAGRIGDYRHCSFRLVGTGTFHGEVASQPSVGKKGQLERVEEVRVEVVCPRSRSLAVIDAMRLAHNYEEPAFDVYPLVEVPAAGIGRIGKLAEPLPLTKFARRLKRRTHARCVSLVGDPERLVDRAIIGVGAAGSMPFGVRLRPGDVVVTGEMRHHDALRILREGSSAVVLSHWSSERPALKALATAIQGHMPTLDIQLSEVDAEPFQRV